MKPTIVFRKRFSFACKIIADTHGPPYTCDHMSCENRRIYDLHIRYAQRVPNTENYILVYVSLHLLVSILYLKRHSGVVNASNVHVNMSSQCGKAFLYLYNLVYLVSVFIFASRVAFNQGIQ